MKPPTIYLDRQADHERLFRALWARGVRFGGSGTEDTQWREWIDSTFEEGRVTYPWYVLEANGKRMGANMSHYGTYMPTNSIAHFLERATLYQQYRRRP